MPFVAEGHNVVIIEGPVALSTVSAVDGGLTGRFVSYGGWEVIDGRWESTLR